MKIIEHLWTYLESTCLTVCCRMLREFVCKFVEKLPRASLQFHQVRRIEVRYSNGNTQSVMCDNVLNTCLHSASDLFKGCLPTWKAFKECGRGAETSRWSNVLRHLHICWHFASSTERIWGFAILFVFSAKSASQVINFFVGWFSPGTQLSHVSFKMDGVSCYAPAR